MSRSRWLPFFSRRSLDDLPDLCGHLAVDVVQDQLGVAQDGVQGRSKFMAHARQKFGFVLVGLAEFATLDLKLLKQPGIVQGNGGLSGKGLNQLHRFPGEFTAALATHHQAAHQPVLPQKGYRQH